MLLFISKSFVSPVQRTGLYFSKNLYKGVKDSLKVENITTLSP